MIIWVLDSDSGITLLYKPYIEIQINEDLVSGLLTALNQFAAVELKQSIESIDMQGLRWVYLTNDELRLLFIAADTKDVNAEILRARLGVIRQSFIQEYIPNADWRDDFDGNTQIFHPFHNIIDEYYANWKQAESITTIAEFFDILGIFQQLFFNIHQILQRISDYTKNQIFERIEVMFENYYNHEYVKQYPELNKITFSKDSGINIISINPATMTCDMIVVEKQIVNLVKRVVTLVKEKLGYYDSLKFFLEEGVIDYILNNIQQLSHLNLDKFLLQLFLLK